MAISKYTEAAVLQQNIKLCPYNIQKQESLGKPCWNSHARLPDLNS